MTTTHTSSKPKTRSRAYFTHAYKNKRFAFHKAATRPGPDGGLILEFRSKRDGTDAPISFQAPDVQGLYFLAEMIVRQAQAFEAASARESE